MLNYWTKPVSIYPNQIADAYQEARTKRLILTAFLGALAAIFQSAGGWLPGVGYLISPLATAPIVICAVLSLRTGVLSYLLAIVLLFLIQPSELFIFPFTTGLLGLAVGVALRRFKGRLPIIFVSGLALFVGILLLAYGVDFPILGPSVSETFDLVRTSYILAFCLFYGWIWMEVSLVLLKRMGRI